MQPFRGRYQRLDLRNHRKLLVVDGRVAFVGSQNLIDRSYNKKRNIKRGLQWQELMCRLEGPVASSIDMVFATDWVIESGEDVTTAAEDLRPSHSPAPASGDLDCQVVPSGPGFPVETWQERMLQPLPERRRRSCSHQRRPAFGPEKSTIRVTDAC